MYCLHLDHLYKRLFLIFLQLSPNDLTVLITPLSIERTQKLFLVTMGVLLDFFLTLGSISNSLKTLIIPLNTYFDTLFIKTQSFTCFIQQCWYPKESHNARNEPSLKGECTITGASKTFCHA